MLNVPLQIENLIEVGEGKKRESNINAIKNKKKEKNATSKKYMEYTNQLNKYILNKVFTVYIRYLIIWLSPFSPYDWSICSP